MNFRVATKALTANTTTIQAYCWNQCYIHCGNSLILSGYICWISMVSSFLLSPQTIARFVVLFDSSWCFSSCLYRISDDFSFYWVWCFWYWWILLLHLSAVSWILETLACWQYQIFLPTTEKLVTVLGTIVFMLLSFRFIPKMESLLLIDFDINVPLFQSSSRCYFMSLSAVVTFL